MASLMASFSVLDPAVTGTTVAPSNSILATLSACRRVSSSPMYDAVSPISAAAVAVATPCCRRRSRDHPPLAHPLGEQGLAENVVDLVRTGVVEVLSLG